MELQQLQQWISRAQQGDQAAFFCLFQQFRSRVFAVCIRLLPDRHQAEDACQEVFVRVWQQLPCFRGDSQFSTWLHSIATRTAIDLWRKLKIDRATDSEIELDSLVGARGHDHQRDLEQCIARLPEQARLVFVLFAIEGHSHAEIATLLDIAEGTSKAQYHRARQLLRGWLDEI